MHHADLTAEFMTGLTFEIAEYEPALDITGVYDPQGVRVVLAPGLHECHLWIDAHPGFRVFRHHFFVLDGGPPNWSSF